MKFLVTVFVVLTSIQTCLAQSDQDIYLAWLDSMTSDHYIGIKMELDHVIVSDSADRSHLNNPIMQMNMRCTDQLLHCLPGVNMIRRGNFANEPMLRGLSSDRYIVSVDGMRIYGACTDKMDPTSSYIEPINLKSLDVSFGCEGNMTGCGTGGSVNFGLKKPIFNSSNPFGATANMNYSSVSRAFDQSLDLNYSRRNWAVRLSGVHRKSGDYTAGDGQTVQYSQFEKYNYTGSINYRINSLSMISLDFVGDNATNIGYPALPMDVAFAKAKIFGLTYFTDRMWFLREPEVKFYHNTIRHEMDDTHRDSVTMHMDMPGHTRTTGGYISGILLNSQRSSVNAKADFHHVFWHAEMTMYPNEAGQQPMYMLTWPDIHRSIGGIEFSHTRNFTPNNLLNSNLRLELGHSYISSHFGERQLSVFDKGTNGSRSKLLVNASMKYQIKVGKTTTINSSMAYGERLPNASEQFGFYLFNQQDGYDYLGDPDLAKENNIHLEFGQNTSRGDFYFETTAFGYLFDNYIMGVYDSSLSHMTIGAKGVKWYKNTGRAVMFGGEILWKNRFFKHLNSEFSAKYVFGRDSHARPLPQMPPLKLSYSLLEQIRGWDFQPEVTWSSAQNRISEQFNERPTDSFLLVNFGASKSIKMRTGSVRISLGISNIFNASYREHFDIGSILRPGRSIDLMMSWRIN